MRCIGLSLNGRERKKGPRLPKTWGKPAKYRFPGGMRPASVRERTEFYRKEFNLRAVTRWFKGWNHPIVFAAVIGRHTRIYPPKFRGDWKKTILIDEYDNLSELRRYLTGFSPESAYYDRNVYASWEQARRVTNDLTGLGREFGQQLAIDIDPENFDCPIHGGLEGKMRRHQGLAFCRLELQLAKQQTIELVETLSEQFTKIRVVYSGRGFHLHIFDEDTFFWPRKKRLTLARGLTGQGYTIDEWVLAGGMRLIRLPYSLNGLVSRIALPLGFRELERFDPIEDPRCIPQFASGSY